MEELINLFEIKFNNKTGQIFVRGLVAMNELLTEEENKKIRELGNEIGLMHKNALQRKAEAKKGEK